MRPRSSAAPRRFRFDSKLTAYSIAGAAVLAAPQIAKADDITFVGNVNQSISSAGTNNSYTLNLPNANFLTFTSSTSGNAVGVSTGTEVTSFDGDPTYVSAGSSISTTGKFTPGGSLSKLPTDGTPAYLGFYFTDVTLQEHTGWAQIEQTTGTNGSTLDLLSYAYENNANVAITTPAATPEPSALSLVALGASGLAYLRRRKNAAAA